MSNIPAIPTTLLGGNPVISSDFCAMASNGFVTIMCTLSGEYWEVFSTTLVTMFILVNNKSSLLIPGFRAIPEVTTTMSDSDVSS